MHLVEVDVVGLESPQRAFARVADVPGRKKGVVGPVAHRSVDLCGDDHLLAAAPTLREPSADDLLGDALAFLPSVDVGGVEEVEAGIERRVHDLVRCRLVGLRTEVHGAEAQTADGQTGTTEMRVFHAPESDSQLNPRITREITEEENPRRCSAPATRMYARRSRASVGPAR